MLKRVMKKIKLSKIFLKYLFSYIILVVFIITCLSIVLFNMSYKNLRAKLDTLNSSNLKELDSFIANTLEEFDLIALNIKTDIELMPYNIYINGYYRHKASAKIDIYRDANSTIHDIVLFYGEGLTQQYDNESKFITSNSSYTPTTFYNYIYPFETWIDISSEMSSIVSPVILSPQKVDRKGQTEEYLIYISPLTTVSSNQNQRGVVFFLVDRNVIDSKVEQMLKDYNGRITIYKEDGSLLYYQNYGEEEYVPQALEDGPDILSDEPVFEKVKMDDVSYVRIKLSSSAKEFTYIVDVMESNYTNNFVSELLSFSLFLVLVFLVGLFVAYVLSRRNYKPISRLVEIFTSFNNNEEPNLANIAIEFEKKELSNKELNVKLEKAKMAGRYQFVQNLINGRFQSEEKFLASQREAGVIFTNSSFLAAIVRLHSNDGQLSVQDNDNFYICALIEEKYSGKGMEAFLISLENRDIAMILSIDLGKHPEEMIYNDILALKEFVKNESGIDAIIGIGRIHDNPLEVYLSFKEASDAISFSFVKCDTQVFFSEKLKDVYHLPSEDHMIKDENKILQFLVQGSYKNIEVNVNKVIDKIQSLNIAPDTARRKCVSLTNIIEKAVAITKIETNDSISDKLYILQIMPHFTIQEYKRDYLRLCYDFCKIFNESRESNNTKLKEDVKVYILQNYSDDALTLDSISKQFCVSPSYLTRYFKNQTGKSLMKYLDSIRIECAERLLKTTELPIDEVVEHCGYFDKSNFIQKFKKNYGYTPVQYRKKFDINNQ